jgi:DNA-binding NtrC family response regulator
LFYRLHVFPIAVPPLREHPEDIPGLVRHFLARIAAEEGKRIRAVSGEALALLGRHRWPGNVRQLENAIFRAVVLAEGDAVGLDEFPQIAAQVAAQSTAPMQGDRTEPNGPAQPFSGLPHAASASVMVEVPSPLDVAPPPAGLAALNLLDGRGDVRPLEEIEAETIRFAIAHYRGQMSEVARRLRIGRSTLYRKLDILGLNSGSKEDTGSQNDTL